jgi:hypothetical protein
MPPPQNLLAKVTLILDFIGCLGKTPAMNRPWKAVIVDDERLARAKLRAMLEHYPQISITGEADSGDASSASSTKGPDPASTRGHFNLWYSFFASIKNGSSASASFHSRKKSS